MQKFDYSAYFRRVQDMKRLQVLRSDVSWLERYETPSEQHENLLYLGCNILRTPHIAKQVVGVFEHLGLDFVAVGGIQYCCGIAWEAAKDTEKGQGVSTRTIDRMESHRPSRVIMWCPSCNVHFTDIVLGRDQQRPDFEITHTPNFLADLANGPEGLPWRQEVNERVVLHAHAGRTDHPEGRRRSREDREAVLSLLQAVPGLEVLDVLISDPEMDYDCGGASQKLPSEVFRRHPARDAGAGAGARRREGRDHLARVPARVVRREHGPARLPELHLDRRGGAGPPGRARRPLHDQGRPVGRGDP